MASSPIPVSAIFQYGDAQDYLNSIFMVPWPLRVRIVYENYCTNKQGRSRTNSGPTTIIRMLFIVNSQFNLISLHPSRKHFHSITENQKSLTWMSQQIDFLSYRSNSRKSEQKLIQRSFLCLHIKCTTYWDTTFIPHFLECETKEEAAETMHIQEGEHFVTKGNKKWNRRPVIPL